MTIFIPLALFAATAPQDAPAPADDVVVTGRLAVSQRALADCIARNCPAAEDIKAALRHAESQFINGDYQKAWATLRSARDRNRDRRNAAPEQYSDLMRATALVTRHLGEDRAYHIAAVQARAVLRENRPDDDPMLLAVSLEVGDMYLRTHRPDSAEGIYRDVAERARAGRAAITEGAALLRLVSLYASEATRKPALASSYLHKAKSVATEVAARAEPEFRRFDAVAGLMTARLAAQLGDDLALEDAIEKYARLVPSTQLTLARGKQPQLDPSRIGAPVGAKAKYSIPSLSGTSTTDRPELNDARARRPVQDFNDQWFDASFWVRPDGKVEDVAILRKSKRLSGGWELPVLDAIRTREYVPLALDPLDPGMLRIERYTYTAPFEKVTGSIIPGRSPARARVTMLDLSLVANKAARKPQASTQPSADPR